MLGVLHAHPPVVFSVLDLTAVGSRLDLERKDILCICMHMFSATRDIITVVRMVPLCVPLCTAVHTAM